MTAFPLLIVSTTTRLCRNQAASKLWMRFAADLGCRRNAANSTTTTSHDEDPCLQWARANRDIAQACLQPPPTEPSSDENSLDFWKRLSDGSANWNDFWQWRQWDFSASTDDQSRQLAQALTTRAMTTPLTAFSALMHSLDWNAQNAVLDLDSLTFDRKNLKWCCLGARSEASLPSEYWKELLILMEHYDRSRFHRRHSHNVDVHNPGNSQSVQPNVTPLHLQIDFCGPDMDARRPDVCITTTTNSTSSTLTLRWVFQGKYHDYHDNHAAAEDGSTNYDAFLLFNPGVGHPNLRDDWRPTLDLLLGQGRQHQHQQRPRVLLTAHSEYDASRDAAFLYSGIHSMVPVEYATNPFGANLEYEDPLLDGHRVRPNHYYSVIV